MCVSTIGKTYTVTGTSTEPGLLPRSLDVVFNTIDQRQFSSVAIRPKHFSDVAHLSERETEREQLKKEEILAKVRCILVTCHCQKLFHNPFCNTLRLSPVN